MLNFPKELAELTEQQEGLVSRKQLSQFNIDSHAITRSLSANRWQSITGRVIKISTEPLTRKQELIAALLHHENLSLTGVAALEWMGMETNHDRRIDLIGPRGTRVEPFPNAVLHTSRRAFTKAAGFPSRTCHVLTVVYAMAWAKSLRQARHYAYWSIQHNLVTLAELCDTAFSNRHSSLMKKALPRVLTLRDQIDTVDEHLFVDLCRKHEITGVVRKPEFLLDDGTPIHPDFGIWVDDEMEAVEIDGSHHETAENQAIDAYRMRVLKSYGVDTFRTTNKELRENGDAVMRALKFRLERKRRRHAS